MCFWSYITNPPEFIHPSIFPLHSSRALLDLRATEGYLELQALQEQ